MTDEERTTGSSAYTLSSFEDEDDGGNAFHDMTEEEEEIFSVSKYRSAIPFISPSPLDEGDAEGQGATLSFNQSTPDQRKSTSSLDGSNASLTKYPPYHGDDDDDVISTSHSIETGSATLSSVHEFEEVQLTGDEMTPVKTAVAASPLRLESAECRRRAMRVLRLVQEQEHSSRSRIETVKTEDDEFDAQTAPVTPSTWSQSLRNYLADRPKSQSFRRPTRTASDVSVASSISVTTEMFKSTAEDWKLLKECYRDLAVAIVNPQERRKLIDSLREEPALEEGDVDTFGWNSRV